jgi:hypothetical protein
MTANNLRFGERQSEAEAASTEALSGTRSEQ